MTDPRTAAARRLGARPLPLNAYEIAEYRQRWTLGRVAWALFELAVIGAGLSIAVWSLAALLLGLGI